MANERVIENTENHVGYPMLPMSVEQSRMAIHSYWKIFSSGRVEKPKALTAVVYIVLGIYFVLQRTVPTYLQRTITSQCVLVESLTYSAKTSGRAKVIGQDIVR